MLRSRLFDAANPTGYAQAVEEFEVVAAAPSSWVRTRSTVVGLDVLSTSTPRFAYPVVSGEPVPQPDAPLVMVYDAGGSVRDVLANHEAAGDLFTFAERADGATGGTPGASNPVLPQRADYDAFGELILFAPAGQSTPSVRRSQRDAAITALEQALLSHLTYRGEQYDPHLRMQYLRARHYDQGTGRFTRVDPFAGVPGEPLTLHKYAYAEHDPANGIDPSGLFTLPDILGSLKTFSSFVAMRLVAIGPQRALSSFIQSAVTFHWTITVIHPAQEAIADLAAAVAAISPSLAHTLRDRVASLQRGMAQSALLWGFSPVAGVIPRTWALIGGVRIALLADTLSTIWSDLASGLAFSNPSLSITLTSVPRSRWEVVPQILLYQISPANDIRLMTQMVRGAIRREPRSTLQALGTLWREAAPQYFESASVTVSLPWIGGSWSHQF